MTRQTWVAESFCANSKPRSAVPSRSMFEFVSVVSSVLFPSTLHTALAPAQVLLWTAELLVPCLPVYKTHLFAPNFNTKSVQNNLTPENQGKIEGVLYLCATYTRVNTVFALSSCFPVFLFLLFCFMRSCSLCVDISCEASARPLRCIRCAHPAPRWEHNSRTLLQFLSENFPLNLREALGSIICLLHK